MDEVAGSKGARGRGGGGCTGAQGRITSHIAPPMLCDGPEPSEVCEGAGDTAWGGRDQSSSCYEGL
jgi:hypothetical protein